jgi:hypothetical protein
VQGRVLGLIGEVPVDDSRLCGSCLREEVANIEYRRRIGAFSVQVDQDGGEDRRWDYQAEVDVGALILGYLDDNPAPDGARFAGEFQNWGERLERIGKRHLDGRGSDGDEARRAA